jgi:hypothetical protein
MGWTWNMTLVQEKRVAYVVQVGMPEEKRWKGLLGISRLRWKIILKEIFKK